MTKFLVTGGCGFIGTNLIIEILKNPQNLVLNIDSETYASNLFLAQNYSNYQNYLHHKVDLFYSKKVAQITNDFAPNYIIHLAAESHVDNSILNGKKFIRTNVLGTHSLLDAAIKTYVKYEKHKKEGFKFIHISTDEVYGSLNPDQKSSIETDAYNTSSPYSASKAASDHLVIAWWKTYKLPSIITHCSNNYGPHQHPEKLIPKIIHNLLMEKKIPLYGNGRNIRDWIHVSDHVKAILKLVKEGSVGETYNIGGLNQKSNIDIVKMLIRIHSNQKSTNEVCLDNYVEFVTDRLGHDYRYSINCDKLLKSTDWKPQMELTKGLTETYNHYKESYFK